MSFVDTYFDKIFYISLEEDEQRRIALLEQFKRHDINNVEWVKGIRFDRIPENISLYRNFIKNKEKYIIGQLGCRQSHINAVKLAYERGYQRVLIFEDDISILKNPSEILHKNLKKITNWNMLYYGGLVEPEFRNQVVTTHAYAIDRIVMPDIINMAESSGMEIDNFYAKIIQHMSFNYNSTGKYNIHILLPFNTIIQNKALGSHIQ
jgi:GR25 family glycosyltransferase involved in LPS biosynthesis